MFRYGFELEGFYTTKELGTTLPPLGWPTDGFPGLIEVRTVGANTLEDAYLKLLIEYFKYNFDTQIYEHTFSPEEKVLLRKRRYEKDILDLGNIYGKKPRALGNRTLASFQINISNQIRPSRYDEKGVFHTAEYGLFDYLPIIRRLDWDFRYEIKEAKRQPGFYAIKDGVRVEYRSLPNTVFTKGNDILKFIERIRKCVEGN